MTSIKIFCSYASDSVKDKNLINRFLTHLDNLERQIQVSVWHARRVPLGIDLKQETRNNLKNARIILLCISPDYMASDNCHREAIQAVRLERAGRAIVRVILLRHVYWKEAVFSRCEALPRSRKFISEWTDKDEIFNEIAQNIKELVQELRDNEIVQGFNISHLGPLSETHALTRTAIPPAMPSIEELRTNRQTDETVLERQTEDFIVDRRTEDLIPKRLSLRKRSPRNFAAEGVSSTLAVAQKKRTQAKNRGKKNDTRRNNRLSSKDAEGWFSQIRQERGYVTQGKQGIFWGFVFGCDVLGLSGLVWYWSNSLRLLGLVLCISLLAFIAGTINIDGLIAAFLSLLYSVFWCVIIYHYVTPHSSAVWGNGSMYPLIIGGGILIFLGHFLLFRRHDG